MTDRPRLTEDQLALLATLTLAHPAGFIYDDPAVREVADGLVDSGHLAPVEGVEGGYTLSDEMVGAHKTVSALVSASATLN